MRDSLRVAVGILSAMLAIVILVLIVGVNEFVNAVVNSDPIFALIACLFAILWLAMWSATFYVVVNSLDLDISYITSFRTYATVMFANNVTPFAHLGGEPLAAGFISKVVGEDYEKCLGGLSAVSVVHFVPSVLFFTFGFLYLGISGSIPNGLNRLIGAFLVLTITILLAGVAVYRFRSKTQNSIVGFLVFISNIISRIPKVPNYDSEKIKKIVHGYFASFLDVATNRRVVFIAIVTSTMGVMCQALGLWFALKAVGVDIPIIIPIIAFPVAGLASALPLPGGAGGIEAVLITIVLAFSSVAVADVTAGVVIMRTAIFWTPIIIGSLNLAVETTTRFN